MPENKNPRFPRRGDVIREDDVENRTYEKRKNGRWAYLGTEKIITGNIDRRREELENLGVIIIPKGVTISKMCSHYNECVEELNGGHFKGCKDLSIENCPIYFLKRDK